MRGIDSAAMEVTGLTVSYQDSVPLNGIDMTLERGGVVITGPSGSGKSTFLRVLAGLQAPSTGTVTLGGTPLVRPTWRSAGDPRVALIHQDYRLVPFLSVAENVALGAELHGQDGSAGKVEDVLDRVRLGHIDPTRLPQTLSGGEQQRVAMARALACGVEVLLADEPTGALDSKTTEVIADIFVELAQRQIVVVATHDPQVAERMPVQYELRGGEMRAA